MTQKEIAQHFLKLCAKGQSRQAFNLYAAPDFKHHNAFFKGDAETLMTAMEEEAKRNPTKIFEVQRTLEDGDLVAAHSHVRQDSNDLGAGVVHIFRFKTDRIVELWDVCQAVPEETVNENGMF